MRQARQGAEVEWQEAELELSRPFLELARQLQTEAQRWAADPDAGAESLGEAFDRLARDARHREAEATFRQLPPEQQWAVLERLFGDDELRQALDQERARHLSLARASLRRAAVLHAVATRHVLDTRLVPAGEQLSLGLFRETDVQAALRRGSSSTTCARRVVLQATGATGDLHVVEDVFNPSKGLFVTSDYDESTWAAERLEAHASVRIGAASDAGFEPLVYPGGRFDIEVAGVVHVGRLHAGWALLADADLFTTTPASTGGNRS